MRNPFAIKTPSQVDTLPEIPVLLEEPKSEVRKRVTWPQPSPSRDADGILVGFLVVFLVALGALVGVLWETAR